jgi:hypothetical protein
MTFCLKFPLISNGTGSDGVDKTDTIIIIDLHTDENHQVFSYRNPKLSATVRILRSEVLSVPTASSTNP